MSTTWNKNPIHIVFYKNTPEDVLEKIVEKHCEGHHSTKKDMCMSLVNVCRWNDTSFATSKGDAGDISVDMIA